MDHTTGLWAELLASLASIEPQVRGLADFGTTSISAETKAAIAVELNNRTRRQGLIKAVLAALEALEADGYPSLPNGEVEAMILKEIEDQRRDLEAAAGVFAAKPMASTVEIVLGEPKPKPES